ncbi:MAG TPA: hypothetical protein VLL72_03310 [Kiloniellales bacterium]|nr:hypothetical protein [Kiloniellales bacterium]
MDRRDDTRQPETPWTGSDAARSECELGRALDLDRLVWDPEYRAEMRAVLGKRD